ncbi:MAG TPA: DUF4241 domain-containing protein [Thermomicrobiales bacterium]|jgi:hypothetical protein
MMAKLDFGWAVRGGSADAGGGTRVTLTHQQIADLVAPSGSIIACDPLEATGTVPFAIPVPPGRYPVLLCIAHFVAQADQRVAASIVQFGHRPPIRWELAVGRELAGRTLPAGERFGYGVDSGLGCFMDSVAAQAFMALQDTDDDCLEELGEKLEETHVPTWGWATVVADVTSGANVVCFHAGWGDGFYSSYLGLDETGGIACLLTDFGIVRT